MQRLLAVLTAGRKAAEAGTAFGQGTRALASTAFVVTVEIDRQRAELAASALHDLTNVEVLVGDWRELLPPLAPFGLLFLDAGGFKDAPEEVGPLAIDLLEHGGLLVADDFTPGLADHGPAREFLFRDEDVTAVEVRTTADTSALIAARC